MIVRNRSCPAVSHYAQSVYTYQYAKIDNMPRVCTGALRGGWEGGGRAYQLELDLLPVYLHRAIFLRHPSTHTPSADPPYVARAARPRRRGIYSVQNPLRSSRGSPPRISIPADSHRRRQQTSFTQSRRRPIRHLWRARQRLTAKRSSKQDLPTPESPTSNILNR